MHKNEENYSLNYVNFIKKIIYDRKIKCLGLSQKL